MGNRMNPELCYSAIAILLVMGLIYEFLPDDSNTTVKRLVKKYYLTGNTLTEIEKEDQ